MKVAHSSEHLMELQDFSENVSQLENETITCAPRNRKIISPLYLVYNPNSTIGSEISLMSDSNTVPVMSSEEGSQVKQQETDRSIPVPEIVTRIARAQSFAPLRVSDSLAQRIMYDIFFDKNMPLLSNTIDSMDVLVDCDSDSLFTMAAKQKIKSGGPISSWGDRELTCEILRLHCVNIPYYIVRSVDIILRGVGQVYICNHPLTGLCICIGYYISSPTLLGFAITGTVGSTLGGILLVSPDWPEISNGLFGYDGTLIGASVYIFFSLSSSSMVEPSFTNGGILIVLLLSVVGGVFHGSAMQMNSMPALTLTLAFNMVLVFYIMIVAQGLTTSVTLKSMIESSAAEESGDVAEWEMLSLEFIIDAVLRGVGQFCFVGDTMGSLMVLVGIWICSRKAAYMAVIGSCAGLVTSRYVLAIPASLSGKVRMGLYSYNSMGAAVAVAGNVFFKFNLSAVSVAVFTSVVVVLIQLFVEATFSSIAGTNFPSLTIPFVITTWLVMLSNTRRLSPIVEGDLDQAMLVDKYHSDDTSRIHPVPEGYTTQEEANITLSSP